MKRNIIRSLKYVLLTFILIIFILNINLVISSTLEASNIFFKKVFLSIFPFVILIDILIYFNYHVFLKRIFGNFISKFLNIDSNSTIIIVLSFLTGSPTNAIYIKDLLDNKIIDTSTADKLIYYTFFPSIPFTIGVIGISLYNSFKIGLFLYLNSILNNIFIALYLKKNEYKVINNEKEIKKENFILTLKNSINNGITSSYIILGFIIIFTIIINLIYKYININDTFMSIISGMLEITIGVININKLSIGLNYRVLLTSFLLNFNGISIILQSTSFLNKYNFNIKKILIVKLIFSLINFLFILSLLMIF